MMIIVKNSSKVSVRYLLRSLFNCIRERRSYDAIAFVVSKNYLEINSILELSRLTHSTLMFPFHSPLENITKPFSLSS